jgi:hypothetical protein
MSDESRDFYTTRHEGVAQALAYFTETGCKRLRYAKTRRHTKLLWTSRFGFIRIRAWLVGENT